MEKRVKTTITISEETYKKLLDIKGMMKAESKISGNRGRVDFEDVIEMLLNEHSLKMSDGKSNVNGEMNERTTTEKGKTSQDIQRD